MEIKKTHLDRINTVIRKTRYLAWLAQRELGKKPMHVVDILKRLGEAKKLYEWLRDQKSLDGHARRWVERQLRRFEKLEPGCVPQCMKAISKLKAESPFPEHDFNLKYYKLVKSNLEDWKTKGIQQAIDNSRILLISKKIPSNVKDWVTDVISEINKNPTVIEGLAEKLKKAPLYVLEVLNFKTIKNAWPNLSDDQRARILEIALPTTAIDESLKTLIKKWEELPKVIQDQIYTIATKKN